MRLSTGLLLSLVIVFVWLSFVFHAIGDFYSYKKATKTNIELTLDSFHFFLKNAILKEWVKQTAPKPLPDELSPLTTFRFTADPKDIKTLEANLPKSGKDHYIRAYMKISNVKDKTYKIKLRYRGDGNYHWLYDQKSLRIKLSKKDVYDMAKRFNLINPPQQLSYRDSIVYNLSKKLGLISPEYIPSRVFINGRYMGVYIYLSQVDESLLRAYRLMPGSIYYGDGSPIGKDGIAALWRDQKYWQKKASRNAEQKKNREDIKLFINSINSDPKTFYKFADIYLNKKKFFTFIALDRAFGSHHHDYIHNHKIYFDPYKGKFEPISWDLRFWLPMKPKDLSLYPLQLWLASDPAYDAKIDKITYNIISNNFIQKVDKAYKKIIKKIKRDLESDIYKDTAVKIPQISPKPISRVMSFGEVKQDRIDAINALKIRRNFLLQRYNVTKIEYDIKDISKDKKLLSILISGDSPAKIIIPKNLQRSITTDEKIPLRNKTILYTRRLIVPNSQHLFSKMLYGTKTVQTRPAFYRFEVDKNISDKKLIHSLKFINYITNKPITPTMLKTKITIKPSTITYPPAITTTVLQGVIEVPKTKVFDKYTQVIIKPGTTFIMYPKASIFFYGKVTAIGTQKKPIKFIAKDTAKPWGIIALQGKAASGSKFYHIEIKDGSVATRHLIHYTAPLSIHDTKDFELRYSTIGKNFIGDDSMHIAYSQAIVSDCTFVGARSDGLDIDISQVTITHTTFINSGNDCLDIMTTDLNASKDTFINCGDKGISVGEWSKAFVDNSSFIRDLIGLQIKDRSKVYAKNLTFKNSKEKAIDLYRKNKRYGKGGYLKATKLKFIGNDTIKADKRSSYEIY